MNDIIANTINREEFSDNDIFLQTHTTNPLLTEETIENAIKIAKQNKDKSLFSIDKIKQRAFDTNLTPINHNAGELLPTQKLNPIIFENSCMYIFSKGQFNISKNRISKNSIPFETNKLESIDIDEEEDWIIAEALLNRLRIQSIF